MFIVLYPRQLGGWCWWMDLCDIVMVMFIGDFYFDTRGFQPSLCRAVELWTGNMLTTAQEWKTTTNEKQRNRDPHPCDVFIYEATTVVKKLSYLLYRDTGVWRI